MLEKPERLTATNEFTNIAKGVLSHHERWDGTGYPSGIKGHEIPITKQYDHLFLLFYLISINYVII
ncbi:HD domain-containing phosphohydrolase [Acetobacterium malicum]|uniref:HD domain-containing phosphohydrolase n=1 Tax=Acetobacterium malicum TaxID=52692 RepID=UPI0039BFD4E9